MPDNGGMALADVLTTYDRVALNLDKLDRVWQQIAALLPEGPFLGGGSPDEDQYQQLAETWAALRDSLPAINGWRITAEIVDYAAIGQARLDYLDLDEPEGLRANNTVYRPGAEAQTYRRKLARAPRSRSAAGEGPYQDHRRAIGRRTDGHGRGAAAGGGHGAH